MEYFYIALIVVHFERMPEKRLYKNKVSWSISILLLLWSILRECQKLRTKLVQIGSYIAVIVEDFEEIAKKGM